MTKIPIITPGKYLEETKREDLLDIVSEINPTPTPIFPKKQTSYSDFTCDGNCGMTEGDLAMLLNRGLGGLRDYRDKLMALSDEGEGRPHSHGETDNTRGLRIRAISIAITDMESAMKRFEDAKKEDLKEYLLEE